MGVWFVFGIKSFQEARVNLPKTRKARVSLGAGTGELHQGKLEKNLKKKKKKKKATSLPPLFCEEAANKAWVLSPRQ